MPEVMLKDKKFSQPEIMDLISPMKLDFIAYYKVMEEVVNDILHKGIESGENPDAIIDAVERLFNDDGIEPSDVEKVLFFSPVHKAARKLQGRMEIHGLPISIENKKGSVRRGTDENGHEWKIKMKYPYGYIRLTEGTDGDHVDCYIGDDRDSTKVFIIHQNNPDTGKFDEDKCMLGFSSGKDAKKAFMSQYDRPGFFGTMDEVNMESFKKLIIERKGQMLKVKKAQIISNLETFLGILKDKRGV